MFKISFDQVDPESLSYNTSPTKYYKIQCLTELSVFSLGLGSSCLYLKIMEFHNCVAYKVFVCFLMGEVGCCLYIRGLLV